MIANRKIKIDNYIVQIKRNIKTNDNYNVMVRIYKDGAVFYGFTSKQGTDEADILLTALKQIKP